ncbi:glycosyl transferase, group 1 family protein [Dissulfuribacter thermophilus]|uniref:Glycosyl transferase, group 1 family protein n=1 Tax=Dissulfuribacter thermophilus TaxID=1156395 RepID=A0A1B9F7F6_9BACT|nr:glycosyltransferase family 2 protein [Dissulfuribacter thermophilus]OCC15888.1 glycosyl transferase, group 1 family protein [Dissulfuribacter thermophilus]
MFEGKSIAVVIPAYNESALIGKVIETMPEFVDHIIVVDDCSRDNTKEIVKRYQSTNPKITLIEHQENQGVGGAIVTGYKWARGKKIDVTAVMAGDAQMDPADLPNIVRPVARGEADYTKGNRLFHGEAWKVMPKYRYLGNSFLSLLTKIASGYWHIADSQTGYTAISLEALELLDLDKIYKRYGMPNDILIRLNELNMRVRDVPVRPVYNIGEKSGIKLRKVLFTIPVLLLRGFFRRLFFKYVVQDFHPLVFFYLMGLTLTPSGFLFGLYLIGHRLMVGPVNETSALFAAFLFISGLQSLFFAMWFDMDYNKELK